ncbi:MAG: hypothetical protein ACKVWR_19140 [Acidimicrobiales bacterium]
MSLRPYRDVVDSHRAERDAVLAVLDAGAPDEVLLAIAYWTAIDDHVPDRLTEAVRRARDAGFSWGAIGVAHDRTPGSTQVKFARRLN